jgi:uncharacterized DUF497 family protein
MRYVWDATKDVLNQRKHGLSLADGIPALEDAECESWTDDRFDYEEERIVTLGRNKDAVLLVVSFELGLPDEDGEQATRIISVRKAMKHEKNWYNFGRP